MNPIFRLRFLAMMIWGMPDDATIGELKRRIIASPTLAGREIPATQAAQ